jgi:hypothetical protein
MRYKDFAKTFDIISAHNPEGVVMDWADHDEYGIGLDNVELTPSEVRMLAEIGWLLGSDNEFDEEEMEVWINPSDHSDEELMELWKQYKSIYKYA